MFNNIVTNNNTTNYDRIKWIHVGDIETRDESREIYKSADGLLQKLVVWRGTRRYETISSLVH